VRNLNISSNSSAHTQKNSSWIFQSINNSELNPFHVQLQSSGRAINEIGIKTPLWRKEILELPLTNKIIETPQQINQKVIEDILNIDKTINLPTDNKNGDAGKQAARLIVIRRAKMRRHKLKKLRKKMKFVWGKAKQKREWKKERAFLDGLLNQIKEAQKFSAEEYVDKKLNLAAQGPVPKRYKGKPLPKWLVMELMEKDRQEAIAKKYAFWEKCDKK
jgi:Mitochondrial domain of unknown function (DUF1713)